LTRGFWLDAANLAKSILGTDPQAKRPASISNAFSIEHANRSVMVSKCGQAPGPGATLSSSNISFPAK
jgi:hypothetical protein